MIKESQRDEEVFCDMQTGFICVRHGKIQHSFNDEAVSL